MKNKKIDLIIALMDMVNQHCQVEYDEKGAICSPGFLSANEHALYLLVEHGYAKKIREGLYRLDFKKLNEERK